MLSFFILLKQNRKGKKQKSDGGECSGDVVIPYHIKIPSVILFSCSRKIKHEEKCTDHSVKLMDKNYL